LSSEVPEPPELPDLHPLLTVWERDRAFLRCHDVRFGATEFNPGFGKGRFHPFLDGQGRAVPTLYGADRLAGALSETIFHNIPARGPDKRLGRAFLDPMVISALACGRDLTLVRLYGYGLRHLGITRAELIESEADGYLRTAAWARALHAKDERIDGLVWISRQHDESQALVLFGGRVPREELHLVRPPLPLSFGAGLDEVERAAEEAGILIFD
jgi:RES domain-containing protein